MSYLNPVVRGTAPDPSLVRVGDDYFLATSTFDMLPGVTIRHSTDLVDWRIIGHAITRPAQYRRDGLPGPVVLFAPTIRHHDGTFYLVCTNAIPGQGNFLVTASDPAGEWSDAIWIDEGGFDPSLFRDEDGTWYYTRRTLEFRTDGNLGPIVQAVIDVATGRLGELREITPPHGFASNDIEGPHLYRRGGWYYLCSAEGGSWHGHMQTVARSRSPWGPYEAAPNTPLLTHRHLVGNPVQTIGHAELFEAADGSWWAVSLGTRHPANAHHHNLGRETFLTPVTWIDDWPVAGVNRDGATSLEVTAPPPAPRPGSVGEVPPTLWNAGWRTVGQPAAALSPEQDGDRIVLPAGAHPADIRSGQASEPAGALLRPQTEHDQSFQTTVADQPTGTIAGIAAYADPVHYYALSVEPGCDGRRIAVVTRAVDDLTQRTEHVLPGGPITLRITSHETHYAFEALSPDGVVDLGTGSARLISAEAAQWFVGVHWALLAIGSPGGSVTFTNTAIEDVASAGHASPVPFL